jgi:predicted transcriptional regulator
LGVERLPPFVTGSLQVVYLKPTPIERRLTLRARAVDSVGRKVRVSCKLLVSADVCARGEVVAIAMTSLFHTEAARQP